MFVSKMGKYHVDSLTNCQDAGFESPTIKCLTDGCSEGRHSEVGAKLFCHIMENYDRFHREEAFKLDVVSTIKLSFRYLFHTFGCLPTADIVSLQTIIDYMLFTVMVVQETENTFDVYSCGDGVIIKQLYDDTFEYNIIDQEGAPAFYAYNFIPTDQKKYLAKYQDGVAIKVTSYPKTQYKAIGVASDGLEYVLNTNIQEAFEAALRARRGAVIGRLLNKYFHLIKDDITIII